MKKILISVIIIVVFAAILWMQQRKEASVTATQSPTPIATESVSPTVSPTATASPKATGSPAVSAVKSFTVVGSNFTFAPNKLTVNKGDTVKITFKNSEGNHDWNLDEFNAHGKVISGGQQETIQFVADKSGTFEYYCSVGTHRQMGMKGTLTVK